MKDPFLENSIDGILVIPTIYQWQLRSEQYSRMISSASHSATHDSQVHTGYYHTSPMHGFNMSLTEEMERCFCSGCWISVICIGMAAVDAFSYEIWGHSKVRRELEEIKFPQIDMWEKLRKKETALCI